MFRIDEAIANGDNLFKWNTETQRMEFAYKDEIEAEYNQLFSNLFPDINLDPSTPQGQIITTQVQQDLATIAFCENMLNSFFFGGTGIYLDLWAWNVFGVTRKKGTPAGVNILITGVPNTVIPIDFLVTDGTYEYKITESVTIPSTGNLTALFECTEINEFIAPSDTINLFITVIDGVETINNPNQSIPAILPETDSQLFERCRVFGAIATNSSFRSIMANVAQVQGVTKIAGAENFTDNTITFKGLDLLRHSISICVLGASDLEIAEAIRNSRATGCNMNGTTEVSILEDGATYIYRFYRPIEVPLKVKVQVSIDINSPTNWEDTVKNNVVTFVNNLNIADLVTQPSLAKHLYKNVTGFDIVDVQLSKLSETLGYDSIPLNLNEMVTINKTDIEVIQI